MQLSWDESNMGDISGPTVASPPNTSSFVAAQNCFHSQKSTSEKEKLGEESAI